MSKHAFRCNACGRLHHKDAASGSVTPSACCACGAGVSFDTNGNKTWHPENWEILANATPERLEELGLTAEDVEGHTPHALEHGIDVDNQRIEGELAVLAKKKSDWDANKDALVKQWQGLHVEHGKLNALAQKLALGNDHRSYAMTVEAAAKVKQQMAEVEVQEWTARDDATVAELERGKLLNKHRVSTQPKTVLVAAADTAPSSDKA